MDCDGTLNVMDFCNLWALPYNIIHDRVIYTCFQQFITNIFIQFLKIRENTKLVATQGLVVSVI